MKMCDLNPSLQCLFISFIYQHKIKSKEGHKTIMDYGFQEEEQMLLGIINIQ